MYLSQVKETRLPHDLSSMIAQVLIVVVLNNGRKDPNSMSRILTKKKGAFLRNGTLDRHQTLTSTMTGRWRHLNGYGLLPNGGHDQLLGLL